MPEPKDDPTAFDAPDAAAAELAARLGLTETVPGTLADITAALLDDRDAALRRQNNAEGEVKAINARLEQILTRASTSRHQLTDGSVVQIIAPGPREKTSPERLLAAGVDARIIKNATILTPVKAFVRVDRPKPASTEAAGTAADAVGPVATEAIQ